MDRDVSFPVSHGHMRSLQRISQKARSSHVRGRVWIPDTAPQWGDAWNNMCECLDMAQCRSWHYREYGIQEVLGRCYSLLWAATFRIWDKEDMHVAVVACHVSSFEHDRWHRYEERVGGYHRSQFNAALQDGASLLSGLQSDTRFTREAFWIEMAVSQLESTLWSMCHRSSGPSEIHFDFVVDSAAMHELTEKLYGICSAPQVKCIRATLWLAWARSSAGEADADATASLRCLRLLGTCGLAHYPMQLLPESPGCLVVAVDEPIEGPRTGWMQFDLPASTCTLRKKRSGC